MGFLFKIEEKDDDYAECDAKLYEIQLLKRRIEKLREDLFGARRPIAPRDEKVEEPRQTVERSKEEKRNAELDDLKAKLLGRMK